MNLNRLSLSLLALLPALAGPAFAGQVQRIDAQEVRRRADGFGERDSLFLDEQGMGGLFGQLGEDRGQGVTVAVRLGQGARTGPRSRVGSGHDCPGFLDQAGQRLKKLSG